VYKRQQIRKAEGDLPYISHLFSVVVILSKYTNDENTLIAGIMHDSVEDVEGYNYQDLADDFGWDIADLVRDISEFKNQENKKLTWLDRKKDYLRKLEIASHPALMVCAADKIHNLRAMIDCYQVVGRSVWDNFNAPIDKKLWFYEEVLKILQLRLEDSVSQLNYLFDCADDELIEEANNQMLVPDIVHELAKEIDEAQAVISK